MDRTAELRFPADHPTAAGHFPGTPILPGALLLDAVIETVIAAGMVEAERTQAVPPPPPDDTPAATPTPSLPGAANAAAIEIRAAKFLHPVRPGATLRLDWHADPDGAIRFECRLADSGKRTLTGTLVIGTPMIGPGAARPRAPAAPQ